MDEDYLIRCRLSDLLGYATGGDAYYAEAIHCDYTPSRAQILEMLQESGRPISQAFLHDLDAILAGGFAYYFVGQLELARSFRGRHGIPDPADRTDRQLVPVAAVLPEVFDVYRRSFQEAKEHQATLFDQRMGLACHREQAAFYASEEWARCAKAVRAIDCFECLVCHADNVPLEVHHTYPIYSAFSPTFTRNFDHCGLHTRCGPCHEGFHAGTVKAYDGFHPASPEDVADEKARNRRIAGLHDRLRECRWCRRFVWGESWTAPTSRHRADA